MFIDFETYSEADLKSVGAWLYAKHPSTEILCIGYQTDEEPKIFIPQDEKPQIPDDLRLSIERGDTFHAHNAAFEQSIWHHICYRRWGWPRMDCSRWSCTAATAASFSLPRALEKVSTVMQLSQVKDGAGHRIMLQLSKPKKPTQKNPSPRWTPWDAPEKYETLYEYCKQDIRTEKALAASLRPLPPAERELWLLDQKINFRGIRVDRTAILAALKIIEDHEKNLNAELWQLTGGQVGSVGELKNLQNWLARRGMWFDDLQASTIEEALKKDLPTKEIRRVLEIRAELSMSSTKKYRAFLLNMDDDDRVRDTLLYHAASTGRWAGKRIQPQNFPRGTISDMETLVTNIKTGSYEVLEFMYGSVMEALSSGLRGMFIASEGKDLFVGDYAQIEARIVMWLAGEEKGLEQFQNNEPIYEMMAAAIYKVELDTVKKDERQLGKQAVLGCGFGMGGKKKQNGDDAKFKETCAKYGIIISDELSELAVNTYRQTYPMVPKLWRGLESAARDAILVPGRLTHYRNISFQVQGRFLYMRLPSGRCLAYPDPKIIDEKITHMGEHPKTKKWTRLTIWGGVLAENATQAVARDIMAAAMKICEAAGYENLLSIHDEMLNEKANGKLDEFLKLMTPDLPWAKGLPLKAEGWTGKRYRK